MVTTTTQNPTLDELRWCAERARVPRLRSIRQFAVDELVVPEGQYRGLKLRIHRQPWVGLLLDELASGRWRRSAVLGCVQSGKTLIAFVLLVLYYLFECRESVIVGLPTMDVAADKWRDELLPAIEATRYRDLVPRTGPGSRGGTSNLTAIKFTNGRVLRFMTGAGRDETRSSYTARVVIVTEADKMDTAGEASREADPVSQLEARTFSWDAPQRRCHQECTVSIREGRIWQEHTAGSASRIACPCPHCGGWVTPEREHLVGWQEAEDEMAATAGARFCCPSCGQAITPEERIEMNRRAALVHRGQTIGTDGAVSGPLPRTWTLGFRWNAFNNLFWSPGAIGAREWRAARAENEEEAKKEMLQFWWAQPYQPPELDITPLSFDDLIRRQAPAELRKGFVPSWCEHVTMGVDVGKWTCWWVLIAWAADGRGHLVDYNTFTVPSKDRRVEQAVLDALREFRDEAVLPGWPVIGSDQTRSPDAVWIDARYQGEAVYAFVAESDRRFAPVLGCGTGRHYPKPYRKPKRRSRQVQLIGDHYHVVWLADHDAHVFEIDADHWKTQLHEGLAAPQEAPGAITLYHSTDRNEHTAIAKHFTAEKQVEEFQPGLGTVHRWERVRKKNHWFDCGNYAGVAGHFCGVRVVRPPQPEPEAPPPRRPPLRTPDGRPYLITER